MADPTSLHRFEALSGPRPTRLLHLSPGRGDDPLRGRLEHISLDSPVAYEALSYEWGPPARTQPILLESGTVMITESLHAALLDLRHECGGPRAVWADGVCINQDDVDERERQVALMGAIYRDALRVVTYIGPEDESSTEAIAFARYLVTFCLKHAAGSSFSHEQMHEMGLPRSSDARWDALRALILRGRAWCAHEFLLNENLVMMCGRTEIPDWNLIPSVVQFAFRRDLPAFFMPSRESDPNSLGECLNFLRRLRSNQDRRRLSLFELLLDSHPFRASDPRDKIYSVINLAEDRHDTGIKVDYRRPAEKLYIAVAKYILVTDGSLEILYSNLHKKTLDLPSWVPDWSTWSFGSYGATCDVGYSASRKILSKLRLLSLENKLEVSGCLIDKVVRLSSFIGPHYVGINDKGSNARRSKWLAEQQAFLDETEPREHVEKAAGLLWRLLIGNITLEEKVAKESYVSRYKAHMVVNDKSPPEERRMAREFCDAARRRSRYRRLASTKMGYVGAVPETTEVGDWICLFHGAKYLFVVRETGDDFKYIGHAYVHGLMKGEVLDAPWYKKQMISLA